MKMRSIPCPLSGGTYHVKNGALAKGEPADAKPQGKASPAPAAPSRKPSREDTK